MAMQGQLLFVSATPQQVAIAEPDRGCTLINHGPQPIYVRADAHSALDALAGTAAQLIALKSAAIAPGARLWVPRANPVVQVSCATGQVAVLRVAPGQVLTDGAEVAIPSTGSITMGDAGTDEKILTIGDGLNTAVVFEFDSGVAATGSVDLSAGTPANGDTVTIGDGSASVVFEFTDGGGASGGNTEVDKNSTTDNGASELKTAIDGSALAITTGTVADEAFTLTNDAAGEAGNVTVTASGANIAVTGMSGGVDAGDDLATSGAVGVAIGATATATATNLAAQINAQRLAGNLAIQAVDNEDGSLTLASDVPGAAGNVTITTDDSNATVSGMSGGATGRKGSPIGEPITVSLTTAAQAVKVVPGATYRIWAKLANASGGLSDSIANSNYRWGCPAGCMTGPDTDWAIDAGVDTIYVWGSNTSTMHMIRVA